MKLNKQSFSANKNLSSAQNLDSRDARIKQSFSVNRVYAIILRHYFLSLHQLDRIFSIFFYPIVALVLWGFLSKYVAKIQSPQLAAFLLGGLILWVIFENVNTEMGLSFMFDIWERNVVNLFSSPITFVEYLAGLITIGIFKISISIMVMGILAFFFYHFAITSLGFGLAFFWINLVIFAWSFGIFNISLVLRIGNTVGPLTWALPFLLQPFSAVFYPVSVLPHFFQIVAKFIPISYVFEGMRQLISTGVFNTKYFVIALVLNFVYLALSAFFFYWCLRTVKKSGQLVKL